MTETPHPIDSEIGARMRRRREALDLRGAEMAGALGIPAEQIDLYERGLEPIPAATLLRAASLLGVPPAVLLGEESGREDAAATSDARAMAAAVARIDNLAVRAAIVGLARAVASGHDPDLRHKSLCAQRKYITR